MKVNAIHNNLYTAKNSQKVKKNPAFAARVQYYAVLKDVISDEVIDITKGPLKNLMDRIIPYLERLDDNNLIVTISGAQKKPSFMDIFKSQPDQGLKFDLNYFDAKKFYNKFMADRELSKFLDPEVLKGLRRKDDALMNTLTETVGVGKLYRPDKGETPEQYIEEVIPKIREHLRIMPKLITERKDIKFNPQLNKFIEDPSAIDLSKRKPWNLYRGIEFDYPEIGFSDIKQVV